MSGETEPKRRILVTTDMDGVQSKAPLPPMKTLVRLMTRSFSPPPLGTPIGIYEERNTFAARMLAQYLIWEHKRRGVEKSNLEILLQIQKIASDYKRAIIFAVLTGREPDKHELTIKSLHKAGFGSFFYELLLNEGKRSVPWKMSQAERYTDRDFIMLHIEDDLMAAVGMNQVNQRFPSDDPRLYIYLIENPSNCQTLREWAGVALPKTIIPVPSVQAVVGDFEQKLATGVI